MLPRRSLLPDNRASRRAVSTVGLLCVLMVGCSERDGPRRIPVRGRVTLGGAPVDDASISFLPEVGRDGPAATGIIVAGEYRLGRKDGPSAGPHKVVVLLDRDDKAAFMAVPGGKRVPQTPAQDRWEFKVTVPGKGPFDYDLTLDGPALNSPVKK